MQSAKRFPHYLRAVTGKKWPQAILCVSCTGESIPSQGCQLTSVERLVSWHCTRLTRHNDTYVLSSSDFGYQNSGFWQCLSAISRISGNLWVVSFQACRDWNLLGLWEELENGRIKIMGADIRNVSMPEALCSVSTSYPSGLRRETDSGNMLGLPGHNHGYLVCEDPPNIARIRLADQSRMIQWVDLRNYGVYFDDDFRPGQHGCCVITSAVQSLTAGIHTAKLGSLRATSGSQAIHGFRASYYNGGVYVHNNPRALDAERNSYFGGRCECLYIGTVQHEIFQLDFRSAYTAVCAEEQFPTRLLGFDAGKPLEPSKIFGKEVGFIADIDIETEEPAYPYRRVNPASALRSSNEAMRTSLSGVYDTDIIYPIGRFRTTLAGPELADAVRLNRVRQVHSFATYQMSAALSEYAHALYKMRVHAENRLDHVAEQLAKRLAVCLSGKFGQRDRYWLYCPGVTTDLLYGTWLGCDDKGRPCTYRTISGHSFRDVLGGVSLEACPAIAAWITSAARVKLIQAIRIAGWEETYYYDTDSIFTSAKGFQRLVNAAMVVERTMGRLQEKGCGTGSTFRGVKDYTHAGRTVCAGCPRGTVHIDNDGRGYWYTKSASEQARAGNRPKQSAILIPYSRHGAYRHGTIQENGRVAPIVLREW